MKKVIIIILSFISLFLLSCKSKNLLNEEIEETKNYTSLNDTDFDITKYEIDEIPFVFLEKLSRLENYQKETIGNTTAKKVISYNQEIHAIYNSKEKHLQTNSSSLLVDVYHEAYFDWEKVRYKNDREDDFTTSSYDEYLDSFGFLPYEYSIEGFSLNKDSILSFEKLSDGKYLLNLDGEKCGNKVKVQMKTFGSLVDYPSFSTVSMEINLNNDFSPIKINFHAEYIIRKTFIGEMNCEQNYTVTYTYLE